jgi:hypothetical protein
MLLSMFNGNKRENRTPDCSFFNVVEKVKRKYTEGKENNERRRQKQTCFPTMAKNHVYYSLHSSVSVIFLIEDIHSVQQQSTKF